jgi:hypothetical protein
MPFALPVAVQASTPFDKWNPERSRREPVEVLRATPLRLRRELSRTLKIRNLRKSDLLTRKK